MADLLSELNSERSYAETMRDAAAHWMQRAQQLEREVFLRSAALVDAAGGKIEVGPITFHRLDDLELVIHECPERMTKIFRTKER